MLHVRQNVWRINMNITRQRFELALKQLTGGDWSRFEQICSSFLSAEFSDLRTMASPSGDGGRDSELFSPNGIPFVVIQYSVQKDWRSKIKHTIERLESTFPGPKTLVFMSNHQIGAEADTIKSEAMKKHVIVDVRDRSWFLDRMHLDQQKSNSAKELARDFVTPLLESHGLDEQLVVGLSGSDARAALMFLEMQVHDSDKAYGLTKASFDALVKAALRDTDTQKRLARSEIYKRISAFLPQHSTAQLKPRVDSALLRLSAKAIRWRKDGDEFHLLDSEKDRVADSAAAIDALRSAFEADIIDTIDNNGIDSTKDKQKIVTLTRTAVEIYFLRKGEEFAQAVVQGRIPDLDSNKLRDVVYSTVKEFAGAHGQNSAASLLSIIQTILVSPSPATTQYLNLLLNSYTLFAFLAATPDVQKVTRDMFGRGEIWLDATIILPLLAEHAQDETSRPFSAMIKQARTAGLKLYITTGMIEEVERHINRCRAYARSTNWEGKVPYLYTAYILAGKSRDAFMDWLENFAGYSEPLQDVADYLNEKYGIEVDSASDYSGLDYELVERVKSIWRDVQRGRRQNQGNLSAQAHRLAEHDAECYLHVLSRRVSQQGKSPLGYTDWWLTLDGAARKILDKIPSTLRSGIKYGPVMSLDFLLRYLAFGPNRERVDLTGEALSKIYAGDVLESLPEDLLTIAQEVRSSYAHLPEHIIKRRVRDRLNSERSKAGDVEEAGMEAASSIINSIY